MKKKIVITGACGFIGHHLCEHFIKNTDWTIIALDKLTYAARGFDRVRDINVFDDKRVKFFTSDINSEITEGVIRECGNIDYILHVAAESISENTFIPIKFPHAGIKVMTFIELWDQKSKFCIVEHTRKGQRMKIKDDTKALGFYNGGQWCKIKYITRHRYNGKVIKMIQKGAIVNVTPNHSVYSANLELSKPGESKELLVIRNVNEYRKKYITEDKNLLKFLAAYITEGSLTKNKANGSYQIQIDQNDLIWLYDLKKSITKLGYNCNITERKCSNLCISNKKLYEYLEKECGRGSGNKKMPDFVFDLEPELKEYFWECMLEGDGNIEENGNQRYTTSSERLAAQIGLFLSLQGKTYSVSEREFEKDEWNDCWSFRINKTGNTCIKSGTNKIKEIDYDGWVYDIEVENSHNFACGIGNAVCHNTHVDNSIINPKAFVMTNIIGTYNVLEFARKCKNLKAFVYFSTDEIFGPAPKGVNYKEWDRYNSTNPYSATKAGAEELCLAYMNTYGLKGFITHCMNVFGERQHPEKFIPLCIRKIRDGEKVTIHGTADGKQSGSRFYIHARNVANAIHFLLYRFEQREKYNIVGEKELSNLEMAQIIAKVMGKELKYEIVDFHSSRPGHDLRYALDGEKMAKMGWDIPITIEQTLETVVKWTLSNSKWL